MAGRSFGEDWGNGSGPSGSFRDNAPVALTLLIQGSSQRPPPRHRLPDVAIHAAALVFVFADSTGGLG